VRVLRRVGQLPPDLRQRELVVARQREPLEAEQTLHAARVDGDRLLVRFARVVELGELIFLDVTALDEQIRALGLSRREPNLGADQANQVGPQRAPVEHAPDRPQVAAQRRIRLQRAAERLDCARLVLETPLG
jgi:hypothetical protein